MTHILGPLTPDTSLETIQQMVESDFNIFIDPTVAAAIFGAYAAGDLLWSTNLLKAFGGAIMIRRDPITGDIDANVPFTQL